MCIGVMAAVFVFIIVILKPTPDVEEFFRRKQFAQLPPEARAQMKIPSGLDKLSAVISGAFLDWWVPSLVFILATAAWCFTRRRLLLFALSVGTLIAFYGKVHGYAHHHGTVFVAAIAVLWIAWPGPFELVSFNTLQRRALKAMIALLLSLCAINIWDAAVVTHREHLFPYSGAKDAAAYLKSVNATQRPMFGFLFGVAAVQAYFDQNIFANMPSSFFHHGLPLWGTDLNVDDLHRINPEYVVAYSINPDLMLQSGIPQLTAEGYEIVHFSDGYYLYKRAVFERETYFILRRIQR